MNFRPIANVGLIEADPIERSELLALLRRIAVQILCFDTAEAYLRWPQHEPVACLIVNHVLPGMSGLDLLRQLRQRGDLVPVVMLASESDVKTAVAAMREGATDFIEKPYTHAAVLMRVRRVVHDSDPGARH